jgi:hypothetical protein
MSSRDVLQGVLWVVFQDILRNVLQGVLKGVLRGVLNGALQSVLQGCPVREHPPYFIYLWKTFFPKLSYF